jgi:RND family efflux transporter MFP subunit
MRMPCRLTSTRAAFCICASLLLPFATPGFARADPAPRAAYTVSLQDVDDLKSVYATVRSKDLIEARVRTPGTIAALKVDKGVAVVPGQILALVTDPKIALKIKALDAQIVAAQSRLDTASTELERSETLKAKGVTPQARVDQAQTAFDVATNDLKAAQAERAVVETQIDEGKVLAPAAGRVLRVPVTEGSVVMAGESIATIAANDYLLRLEIPERHARFIKTGDIVRLGERGLGPQDKPLSEGHITQVYPELNNGLVVADAEVPGLGTYFVGERVLIWISAGKRQTILVPQNFVFKRYGLDYVRVSGASGGADVVVQTGRTDGTGDGAIEILSGLNSGDKLVQP